MCTAHCGALHRLRAIAATMAASEEFASRYTPADLHLKPYDFHRKPRGPVVRASAHRGNCAACVWRWAHH